MIAARITLAQALIILAIATGGFILAYYISRHSKNNRYPVKPAIAVISTISLWLVVNVIDDRATIVSVDIFFSQVAYFIPLVIFYLFTHFALKFPPATKTGHKSFWNFFNWLLLISAGLIIFSPRGLVEYFDPLTQKLTINLNLFFYIVMGSYLAQLFGIFIILKNKWRQQSARDKKVLTIITGSFYLTAFIGLVTEAVIAFTPITVSAFLYAYLATLVFMVALAYAILRYGALDVGITVSRNVLYWGTTMGLLILLSYIAWLFQKKLVLNLQLVERVSLMVSLGLMSYFAIEAIFDRYLKKHNEPEPFKPFTGTDNFLANIKDKYHLSWCSWRNDDTPKTNKSVNAVTAGLGGHGHETLFNGLQRAGLNRHIYNLIDRVYPGEKIPLGVSSGVALNSIDVNRRCQINLQARSFRDAGPERVSIIITTRKGTFIAGHKKYNLAYSESELKSLRHEINLHRAQLEITDIKRARANHVHQLEHLSSIKKDSLQKANRQLKDNLIRRAQFFQNIATELRTPLTIIEAGLSENIINLPRTRLTVLKDGNRRLLDLIKELQLVGGGHRAITQYIKELNLKNVRSIYKTRYAAQLKNKRQQLLFFVFPMAAKIWINPTHFEQIMDNLLSNAIKYSPSGTKITVQLNVYPGRILLRVSDRGPGIKKGEQHLVFEPFFRSSKTKKIKGTGLGLSTVKRLAALYQGQARVKTNTERGSTFEVDLNVRTEIPLESPSLTPRAPVTREVI